MTRRHELGSDELFAGKCETPWFEWKYFAERSKWRSARDRTVQYLQYTYDQNDNRKIAYLYHWKYQFRRNFLFTFIWSLR